MLSPLSGWGSANQLTASTFKFTIVHIMRRITVRRIIDRLIKSLRLRLSSLRLSYCSSL